MARRSPLLCGIDIGSNSVRIVVAQPAETPLSNPSAPPAGPAIVGIGETASDGIRRGIVVDLEEAVSSVSSALEKAERMVGSPIEHATVAINGSDISTEISRGVVAISKANGEITQEDVMRAIDAAHAVSVPANQEILHIIPRSFTIDNQKNIKDPVGMTGTRLEVEAYVIKGPQTQVKNLTKIIYRTGVDIDEVVLAPLAASQSVLTKKQKDVGTCVIDLGGGTTGLVLFEDGELSHSAVLPVGSGHVTNDIAIGLRTSIDVAEKVKIQFGTAIPEDVPEQEEIDLSKLDQNEEEAVMRRHVAEIIEARYIEIFELVNQQFMNIGRQGKIPGGVILVGGGARMAGVVDVAKKTLNLPVQIGFPKGFRVSVDTIDQPNWATATGLVLWSASTVVQTGKSGLNLSSVKNTVDNIKGWFKSLLP